MSLASQFEGTAMNLFGPASFDPEKLSAADLRGRVNNAHNGARLIESCLKYTRQLASVTRDRPVLLFYAMTALGRHPKGTSAVADFTALFTELGLAECAQAVRTSSYRAEDLAFFWSSECDFSSLFQTSQAKPVKTFHSCDSARRLPPSVMHDEWGETGFFEFDVIQNPMPPRHWNLFRLDDATIVYDTSVWAVLDGSGHPVLELCSREYQHVFFTLRFGEQLEHLLGGHTGPGDVTVTAQVLESALMIQDMVPAPNYCHWVLDQLPRTRHLDDSQQLILHSLSPFIVETLNAMGVDTERVVELNKGAVIRARRLAIDSSTARHWSHPCQDMSPELVQYVRQVLGAGGKGSQVVAPRRRVYISRNRSDRRRISNEPELLKVLERFDFDVVYCEKLSMAEQIQVFANAAVIVAPHGAGLSNVIFCNQATVVEIFNPNYGTISFRLLTQLLGFDYQPIMGRNPVLSVTERLRIGRPRLQRDDIEADIDKLEQCLDKIFHHDTRRRVVSSSR